MTPTQRPTFTQRVIGDGGGFVYLLASGGSAPGSINFDFTTGILPGAITFTRPSIGTYNSSGNILTTASSNVARFNYISGVSNLLIEGSATNLLPQSNGFATAPWIVFSGANPTPAQFVSPDGTNNGWSIVTGAGQGSVYQTAFAFSNIPYTISLWAKLISGATGLSAQLNNVNAFIVPTATLTRFSSTITTPAGSGNVLVGMNGSTPPTDKDGLYGVQLETGSVPTSYIPTTTVPVTRAADSAVFTIPTGIGHLTFTFDDNSTQTVTVSPGSYTIPTTLNRPNLKSIVGSA